MIKLQFTSYRDLKSTLSTNCDLSTVFIIKNFLSFIEVEKVLIFAKKVISNASNFSYQDLNIVNYNVRRDVRPLGQKVKGISQNIFIKPDFELNVEIYNVYVKCAELRYQCLNQYSDNILHTSNTPFEVVKNLGVPVFDIRHYPQVSGHLDPHTDPPSNQGWVGMVFLHNSCPSDTGLYFDLLGEKYFLDRFLEPGDAHI